MIFPSNLNLNFWIEFESKFNYRTLISIKIPHLEMQQRLSTFVNFDKTDPLWSQIYERA